MVKILPQILAFFSLLIIIFIFVKNLGKIDGISKESLNSEKSLKPNFLKRFFSKIRAIFSQVIVFLLEWIVKKTKKLLHLIHFWIIKIKIKRSEGREESESEEVETKKEQEARDRLLAEEEKNLESVIKENLAIKEKTEEKFDSKKEIFRNFFKDKINFRRKKRFLKKNSFEETEDQQENEKFLILNKSEKEHFSEEDIERKATEGVDKEKEAKLKEFFGFSKKRRSNFFEEEKQPEEQQIQIEKESQEDQETENEIEHQIGKELDFLKNENQKKEASVLKKMWWGVWQKLSFGKKKEELAEERSEKKDKSKVEQAITVKKIKEGDENLERGIKRKDRIRFYQKNEKPSNLIKEVVDAFENDKEMDLDDKLGIDKKILEKKIIFKIAKDPKNPENYRQLGEFYIKIKNYEDAVNSYQQILKIKPRDIDAKIKLDKIKLLRRLN